MSMSASRSMQPGRARKSRLTAFICISVPPGYTRGCREERGGPRVAAQAGFPTRPASRCEDPIWTRSESPLHVSVSIDRSFVSLCHTHTHTPTHTHTHTHTHTPTLSGQDWSTRIGDDGWSKEFVYRPSGLVCTDHPRLRYCKVLARTLQAQLDSNRAFRMRQQTQVCELAFDAHVSVCVVRLRLCAGLCVQLHSLSLDLHTSGQHVCACVCVTARACRSCTLPCMHLRVPISALMDLDAQVFDVAPHLVTNKPSVPGFSEANAKQPPPETFIFSTDCTSVETTAGTNSLLLSSLNGLTEDSAVFKARHPCLVLLLPLPFDTTC
eukprot:NODE_262_length_2065_cov_83.362103_g178_i0.p1 GENE.NODE_262_length_2065_cov_83.362103_g178_i0~~NODE_262_length_2065_cov_83.362103_g178_i0.p1  ORF type:complete len:324 (-),score=33.09 NODE_262_length_2065_cov_83.362103_g178_i0:320-1291(-)